MWIYTHVAIAAAVGIPLYNGDWRPVAACALAAAMPDLPFIAQVLLNKAMGRPEAEQNKKLLSVLNDMAHSLPVWVGTLFATAAVALSYGGLTAVLAYAFLGGWLSHIVIDVFTHGNGKKFRGDNYSWPYNWNLGAKLGLYHYRDLGSHSPKPPEQLTLVVFVLALAVELGNIPIH